MFFYSRNKNPYQHALVGQRYHTLSRRDDEIFINSTAWVPDLIPALFSYYILQWWNLACDLDGLSPLPVGWRMSLHKDVYRPWLLHIVYKGTHRSRTPVESYIIWNSLRRSTSFHWNLHLTLNNIQMNLTLYLLHWQPVYTYTDQNPRVAISLNMQPHVGRRSVYCIANTLVAALALQKNERFKVFHVLLQKVISRRMKIGTMHMRMRNPNYRLRLLFQAH